MPGLESEVLTRDRRVDPRLKAAGWKIVPFRDEYERAVEKITGRVDRPLQKIREFRNRKEPGIVVTVDLLTMGVDIPDLEYIVFLRSVKSRILFEQMLGRGTRKGEHHPDKSHFTVFDCFDGSLLEYFRQATGITAEPPDEPVRTVEQVIDDIWNNRDRDYNIRCLVKRLQRVDKQMSAEARELFAGCGIPDGDVGRFARELPGMLAQTFTPAMQRLRDKNLQALLVQYPRRKDPFVIAVESQDSVSSEYLIRDGLGNEYRPADYLAEFGRFVVENRDRIDAIGILLSRPAEWSTAALTELRDRLAQAPQRFTMANLQKAHEACYRKALVEVISMVKHAVDVQTPLLTAEERVSRALAELTKTREFTSEQQAWLNRVREHLIANLTIDPSDFETMPILHDPGGWNRANRVYGGKLTVVLAELNRRIAV